MIPTKKWNLLNADINASLLEVLLHNRNLDDTHLQSFRFSDRLHDPYLLQDMDKAVARVESAISRREKIGIYGDYDVDGIASTAIMVKLFQRLDYRVTPYLPHRERDGYGLKIPGVDRVLIDGIQLLITVDNGISSNEAVRYANEHGLDVIITDHHLQESDLPDALAVVNPNRKDSTYPFNGLCGAGVVYKFTQALAQKRLHPDVYKNLMLSLLDLVTIATIADIVPVRDENFAFLKFGLKILERTLRPGLVELKRIAGLLDKPITPISVGYYLAPRINAAGRLEDASLSLQLLLSDDRAESEGFARTLDKLNRTRQAMQEEYTRNAEVMIETMNKLDHKVIILDNEDWQPGMTGLISGKLKEKYSRPVLVFARDGDGNYVGSCRSTDGFHITQALTNFKELFLNYGGHARAAGLTIPAHKFLQFCDKFIQFSDVALNDADLRSLLMIDSVVSADQIGVSLVDMIGQIGPFGEENPEPVLLLEGSVITEIAQLKNNQHLKIVIEKDGKKLECLWWRKGEIASIFNKGMLVDVAFKPEINNWNGKSRIQLVIEDIRPTGN